MGAGGKGVRGKDSDLTVYFPQFYFYDISHGEFVYVYDIFFHHLSPPFLKGVSCYFFICHFYFVPHLYFVFLIYENTFNYFSLCV